MELKGTLTSTSISETKPTASLTFIATQKNELHFDVMACSFFSTEIVSLPEIIQRMTSFEEDRFIY